MKEIIKDSLKKLLADRYLLYLVCFLIFFALFCAIIIGFSIHPRDIQLPSHYSAYGITHFYRSQWFYLLVFVLFEIMIAIIHSIISVKLLINKGHSIAIMFAWSSVGIVILGLVTALALLNINI